jgi:glycosyltransferase involved in cell wall biosynthesis
MSPLRVGYFPYRPGANPYQRLFANALETAGTLVERIPSRKLAPLQLAASRSVNLLQLDWPHDWYQSRNAWARVVKRVLYRDGLRRLSRRPVVWTVHNLKAHDASDADYEHRMLQALIDVCEGVIVLSRASNHLLRSTYRVPSRTRVEVIHHGHYVGCYPDTMTREAARARLEIPSGERVVLSLGRLQPYKGLEELLTAFREVGRSGDVLLLVGKTVNDDYAASLRRAIAAQARPGLRVDFVDTVVSDEELQTYYNACDVVALPFRQVLNSGSLLLAMSFGCPVVAPRLGSIPEVACPEGWFGYDASNPGGLAGALSEALAATAASDLRPPIRAFTVARYGWESVGTQALQLYRTILEDTAKCTGPPVRE